MAQREGKGTGGEKWQKEWVREEGRRIGQREKSGRRGEKARKRGKKE